MRTDTRIPACLLAAVLIAMATGIASGQTTPAADQLTLNNGDHLTGTLVSATGASVSFRSPSAGVLAIPWTDVKSIQSSRRFAAIRKGAGLTAADKSKVLVGLVSLGPQGLEIRKDEQSAPVTVPLTELSTLVDEQAFASAFGPRRPFSGWQGALTTGIAVTRSTEDHRSVTLGLNAARSDPPQAWMQTRSRTQANLQYITGRTRSAGASIDISVLNARAEYDHYMTPRVYLFGLASFEHNRAQGLDLRQTYGGGPGFILYKSARQTWEAWAALRFSDQAFVSAPDHDQVFGARIGQTYTRTFSNGAVFTEQAGVAPAFTNRESWFAGAAVSLSVPVYRRLSISVTSWDQYVNDAPPGYQKNALQLIVGADWAF